MAQLKVKEMFPPKKRGAEKQGVTPIIAFRAPDDVREYIELLKSRGYSISESCLLIIRTWKDMDEKIEDLWPRIRAQAELEKIEVGELLAKLIRDGMKKK